MLLFDGAFGVLMFGVWIFCIIDVVTTPAGAVRNLPKLLWVVLVVLLPAIGSIAWLVAGRRWNAARATTEGGRTSRVGIAKPGRPSNPDDDEEFLAGLQARADEQRRRGAEGQGEAQPGT